VDGKAEYCAMQASSAYDVSMAQNRYRSSIVAILRISTKVRERKLSRCGRWEKKGLRNCVKGMAILRGRNSTRSDWTRMKVSHRPHRD
jgi:hypothetical protein